MFSGFKSLASSFVQTAVDSLAPALKSSYEQFLEAWRFITNYYVQHNDDTVPLRDTEIPYHLDMMLDILREEDERDGEKTGPCLEYLLQHKILETLCSLGQGDVPVGMKQQVLRFFREFLVAIRQPTLPHINVHRPIKRLVRSCHHRRSHPLEEDYVKFLCIILSKLRDNPRWASFFIDTLSDADREKAKGRCSGDKEFFMFEALTDLLASEDVSVCNQACVGLLDCVELASPDVTRYITGGARFSHVLIERLGAFFNAMPLTLPQGRAPKQEELRFRRTIQNFSTWADYVNDVVLAAQPEVGQHICAALRDTMLAATLAPRLLATAEDQAYAATFYLTHWMGHVTSDMLLDAIVDFLIGSEQWTPEDASEKHPHQLRRVLVERCDSLSPQLTEATLRLFDALIRQANRHALVNLVLRNFPPGCLGPQQPDAAYDLRDVMEAWLALVPAVARTSDETNDGDYYSYVQDAQMQVLGLDSEKLCKRWGALARPNAVEGAEFYEGDLLATLLLRIERMLQAPYKEILLVTGLLSQLACYPFQTLHTYLLDPFSPTPSGRPSLYSALRLVGAEIEARAQAMPNFGPLLLATRDMVEHDTAPPMEEHPDMVDQRKFLEIVVLFEEFCKELTAIVLAKAGGDVSKML